MMRLLSFPPLEDGSLVGELAISDEALSDHSAETIIGDLARHHVPRRLKSDPTMRLAYTSDRDVPHLETRFVRCGGKRYRFVRDSGHAVRVYDDRDTILSHMPSPLPVKPSSRFQRSEQDLCEDIRGWRGDHQ